MDEALAQAVQLRRDGQAEAARQAFQALYETRPDDPLVNFHYAWLHDSLGEERAAVPFYERAIANGLHGDDLRGALLGLGSTFRTLGMYEQSATTLKRGLETFPEAREFPVFYAMTLYNLGQHHEAMRLLLTQLIQTSADADIRTFTSALEFYAEDLDKVWDQEENTQS